jgi:hypothetical protein
VLYWCGRYYPLHRCFLSIYTRMGNTCHVISIKCVIGLNGTFQLSCCCAVILRTSTTCCGFMISRWCPRHFYLKALNAKLCGLLEGAHIGQIDQTCYCRVAVLVCKLLWMPHGMTQPYSEGPIALAARLLSASMVQTYAKLACFGFLHASCPTKACTRSSSGVMAAT